MDYKDFLKIFNLLGESYEYGYSKRRVGVVVGDVLPETVNKSVILTSNK